MSTFTDSQKLAIAADGNVLVSAGAGTGKTRTVVERCLRLIDEGCSIENILMVTFTEAAAAEMRARLRKALEEKLASGRNGFHESLIDRDETHEIRSSKEQLEEQLALLDTAQISTLHSFCLQLVRDHFHELHINPQVSVFDEGQSLPLMHETLDALLDRCYRGELEFAADVRELIRNYGGGSDERIRALVLKLHRYTQSLPPSERWYETEFARLSLSEPEHWREWLSAAVAEWRDDWLPEIQRYAESPNVSRCLRVVQDLEIGCTRKISAAMKCILDALENNWPKPYLKKDYRDPIRAFFEETRFFASITQLRDGRDPLADDWSWMRGPMRALLRVARQFTDEFTKAKRAQAGVDFADLEQLALQLLLDERGKPTDIAGVWRAKFQHVFVDECQDINAAQDAIIRAVSHGEEPEAGTAGNRFLVGDVKQSIYRFRLADPSIFRRYEELWRDGKGGQRVPLADNFRSREAILNFINPLFAALMRPGIGGVSYDADARLRFGNPKDRTALSVAANPGPRVELHVIHKVNADELPTDAEESSEEAPEDSDLVKAPVEDVLAIETEAGLVARRLRELRESKHEIWDEEKKAMRPVEWRDMVVLLRSPAARVETFAKEFSRAGVPLSAARAGFYSAMEVLDLLNLLRLLDNPLQDIPLAAVLRSPLAGLSVDELAAVRIGGNNGESRSSFFAAANRFFFKGAVGAPGSFAASARTKLAVFFKQFERWRKLARQTSLSHCLETVLAETHYEALLLAQPRGRERVANVHRLLELARQYDPYQRQGLYRFLRFVTSQEQAGLDQDTALVQTGNAVRLMSIHRSKGLEFPVVVVACLASRFNTQDLREDILLSAEYGLCAKIIPPHIEQRYPSLGWWLAKRQEKRELLGEEMRLLYVAMTRARDMLMLTAFDKSKHARQRWSAEGALSLRERELVRDTSYFAWLRRWLSNATDDGDWTGERGGETPFLRWQLHAENAAKFAHLAKVIVGKEPARPDEEPINIEALRQRLTWEYPFVPTTKEAAKTNVSTLRRRAQEDEDARVLFHPRRSIGAGLNAADVGSAHHLFLQHVAFDRSGSVVELRNEAERLVGELHLTREQASALDFDALLRFWQSTAAKRVRSEAQFVHRELPFTARFTLEELARLGLSTVSAADEFVIVQGVVDLAILRHDSISVLDFKTDTFRRADLELKVREYSPQLRLYASALARIYNRPVTEMSLHFLALGETVAISG